MIKQLTSVVLGAVLIVLTAGQSDAGILTIGDYVGEPGQTVTATIDLSSLGGADFTSMDIPLQVTPATGSGPSPTLGTAVASTDPGWVWSPFASVNPNPQTFDGTNTLAIYGIAGQDAPGTVSNLEGTVYQIPISIPSTAVQGDVFTLDLLDGDASANISNGGVRLPAMTWMDGSIRIIPEPATGLVLALSLFGFVAIHRRRK